MTADGFPSRLRDVSDAVRPQHVMAIAGPANSGKTALLQGLAGLGPLAKGGPNNAVTLVIEHAPLLGHQSATEALQALLTLSRRSVASKEDLRTALRVSDLPDALLSARTSRLSRIHRLAVWLAFHRLRGSGMLLLDAPIDGSTEEDARDIGRLVREAATADSAVVFTTRDVDVAMRFGDAVITLTGSFTAHDPPAPAR